MNRLVSLFAATAVLSISSAAFADPAKDASKVEDEIKAAQVEIDKALAEANADIVVANAEMVEEGANPGEAQLLSFDGEREFLNTSSRLRVWRESIGYKLTVDAQGAATDCQLTEEFRRTYVNKKLCEVLMKHHHFAPSVEPESVAEEERSYTHTLVYMDMREKDAK